jgi:murein L,D-transpeptidase YcbB/YkuD
VIGKWTGMIFSKSPSYVKALILLVAIVLVSGSLTGCGKDDDKKRPGPILPAEPGIPAQAGNQGKKFLGDIFGDKSGTPPPKIDLTPQEEDKVSILAESMLDFLEAKFGKDTIFFSRYRETFERQIRDTKHFISLMREVYTARKFNPLFFTYEQKVPVLTDEGAALKDMILLAGSHGLSEKQYHVKQLQKALEAVEPFREEYRSARNGLPDERTRALWSIVEDCSTLPDEGTLKAQLLSAGFTNDDTVMLRELQKFYPNLLQTKKRLNAAVQEVDILILHGFFQWLIDFKYVLKAHPFKVTPELSLAHVKFREQLRDDFQKSDPAFASYLAGFIPISPDYALLQKGLGHYKRLRNEGEVDKIRIKHDLKKGQRGDRIRLLTKRLILEGYLEPQQESDGFGPIVQGGLKKYQRKHQLRVTGRTDSTTRSSMNVSMAKRVKQVELGLQRWRESMITRDKPDLYFRVNIPQFEVELWENNQRVRTHRIVVGNTKKETSIERRQRGFFNHTPLLQGQVATVVLNPLWFPPPRLQKELLEDMVREPDFFEKNNYGIKMRDNGTEIIFQKAGPGNALGRVKFLFPNDHHVYLHDTPKKALFERPVRAYSHGCMRLDKPLDLARYLLKRFNGMDDDDIDKILEKEKEHYIKLSRKIPIYVDYNSVGTDAEGWVHFYIDIYKYDKAYWENQLPVENAEDLTPYEIKKLTRSSEDAGEMLDDLDEPGADDGVLPGT